MRVIQGRITRTRRVRGMHSGTDALHLVDILLALGVPTVGARDSLLPPPRDRDAPNRGHAVGTPTPAAARTAAGNVRPASSPLLAEHCRLLLSCIAPKLGPRILWVGF